MAVSESVYSASPPLFATSTHSTSAIPTSSWNHPMLFSFPDVRIGTKHCASPFHTLKHPIIILTPTFHSKSNQTKWTTCAIPQPWFQQTVSGTSQSVQDRVRAQSRAYEQKLPFHRI